MPGSDCDPTLVIGGSRGIGAEIVKVLAERGVGLAFTYCKHEARAQRVYKALRDSGARAPIQVDICSEDSVQRLFEIIRDEFSGLGCLVLSASGGLERDQPASYAEDINVTAQLRLANVFLPIMRPRSRLLFLTSHEAHFSDVRDPYGPYAEIARTKKAGETALLSLLAERGSGGTSITVVSADLVEGTSTAKMLEIGSPEHIAARRKEVGRLPTIPEVAERVADLCETPFEHLPKLSFVGDPGERYLVAGASSV